MRNYLLLHWWGWSSNENWFPWLKGELEYKANEVYVPNLPNTNNPILEEQMEYISVYSWDFDEWWYIIGHSLGCQLALKFIEENNIENSTLILVAPSYPLLDLDLKSDILWDKYEILKKYYDIELNFEKINKLNNNFVVFLSDDDPYINMQNAKNYYKNLNNVEFVDFKNKWHFNNWSWVLELKEILDY